MALNRQTKINLNNQRVEQTTGSTLNLSGTTIFDSGSTLTILSNRGVGKVLTSDSTGIATWQEFKVDKIAKTVTQSAHGFTVQDVIGISGGTYNKAIADGTYSGEIIGIVTDVIDVNNFEVTQSGYFTGFTGLVAGTTYFLSTAVAGDLTTLEPVIDGELSKAVLIADTTTSAWVLPYPAYIVATGTTEPITGIINIGEGIGIYDSSESGVARLKSLLGSGDTTVFASGDTIIIHDPPSLHLDQTIQQTVTGGHKTDFIDFNTLYTDGVAEGRLQWNSEDGTLEIGMPGSNVTLQIGQEDLIKVRNDSGALIENGKVVKITGGTGGFVRIGLADNSLISTFDAIGVATEDISNGSFGYVTTRGFVRGINTSGLSIGDLLWLGTNGNFTNVRPEPPAFGTVIGRVIKADAVDGCIYVTIQIANRLQGLSDTFGTPTTTGQFYVWNVDNSRFQLDENAINYITGATNIGGGSQVYSGITDRILQLRTLVGSGDTTVTTVGDEIRIFTEAAVSFTGLTDTPSNYVNTNYIRSTTNSLEYRTPAQVLSDINAEQSFNKGSFDNGYAIILTGTTSNRLVESGVLGICVDKTALDVDFYPLNSNPSGYCTSIAHSHNIANSGGTDQFTFGVDESVRICGSGATTIGFNSVNNGIIIHTPPPDGDIVPNFYVSNEAELDNAYAMIRDKYQGGNIYLLNSTIILTENKTWNLTGVNFFGVGSNSRIRFNTTVSGAGTTYKITITDGSPSFNKILFSGSGQIINYDMETQASRNIFEFANTGSARIEFRDCEFWDIVGGVDSPVITITGNFDSAFVDTGIIFNNTLITSRTGGSSEENAFELAGFHIKYDSPSDQTPTRGRIFITVFNQRADQGTGNTYPKPLNNSSQKYRFSRGDNNPQRFVLYTDESVWVSDWGTITGFVRENSISTLNETPIDVELMDFVISDRATNEVTRITLQDFLSGTTPTNAITGATNIGGGEGIYSSISAQNLQLRSLVGSGDTTVSTVGNDIRIHSVSPTVNNPTITLSGGTLIGGGGTFTLNQASAAVITFNHETLTTTTGTTTQTATFGGTFTMIDAVTGNSGHITGVRLKTVTLPTPTAANDGQLSISGGTVISGGGIFTANQAGSTSVTLNHDNITCTPSTTAQTATNGGTFTAVDVISSSAQGHITGVRTKTVTLPSYTIPTVNNTTITITGGTSLINGGTFTTNQASPSTITINHAAYTARNVSAINANVISCVVSDTTGHVTNVLCRTLTPANIGAATSTHVHGEITSGGTVSTNVTIANSDRLLITDASDSFKVKGGIAFGTLTTSFLANNGTWQTPNTGDAIIKEITQSSHGFSVGDVVGFSGNTYNKPIASTSYDGEVLGIVNKVINVNTFEFTQAGFITGLTSLVQGDTYYLSPTTAGLLTSTRPDAEGQIVNTMLLAASTTTGWVLPYAGFVVSTGDTGSGVQQIQNIGSGVGVYDSIDVDVVKLRSIIGSGDTTVSLSGETIIVNTDAVVSFTGLTDTPSNYVNGNYIISTTNSLEYRTPAQVLSDINAEQSFNKGSLIQGTDISLTGTLTNRLVNTGDITISHPTSGWAAKTTLSGGAVISNLTVNAQGHISNWSTRTLCLDSLSGVTFNSLTNGQVLTYTGGTWCNITPAAITYGNLNTTSTTALSTSASESFGSNISLHKISKTGTYGDLIGTPTIPTVNDGQLSISGGTVISGGGIFTANQAGGTSVTLNHDNVTCTPTTTAQTATYGGTFTAVDTITSTAQGHITGVRTKTVTLPSAQTIGNLNTTSTTALSTSASESFSGNISLHKISKTGTYGDLIGTPTIPTVNDGTLTVTGGTVLSGCGTFTANQVGNTTITIDHESVSRTNTTATQTTTYGGTFTAVDQITSSTEGHITGVRTKTVTLPAAITIGNLNTTSTTALSTSASESFGSNISLHKISKTGTYGDLIGTPTIPTVNNSNITITGGTNLSGGGTFSLNQSSPQTITINHPITLAGSSAEPISLNYGDTISSTLIQSIRDCHIENYVQCTFTLPAAPNLSVSSTTTTMTVINSVGDDAVLTGATNTLAGIVTTQNQLWGGAKCASVLCGTICIQSSLFCGNGTGINIGTTSGCLIATTTNGLLTTLPSNTYDNYNCWIVGDTDALFTFNINSGNSLLFSGGTGMNAPVITGSAGIYCVAYSVDTNCFDNYVSWNLCANGIGGTQSITSGTAAIFIGGTNVSLARTSNCITINATDTNTATAADNILDGSNIGTEITYAPYTTSQATTTRFYTHNTAPTGTGLLNIGACFRATELYEGSTRVATLTHVHGEITSGGTVSTNVTIANSDRLLISDASDGAKVKGGVAFGISATTFLANNGTWQTPAGTYSLPLAANGTRGGIQIGYAATGANIPVQLSSEKAYVALTKSAVENVLTGSITTHTHNYDLYGGFFITNLLSTPEYCVEPDQIVVFEGGDGLQDNVVISEGLSRSYSVKFDVDTTVLRTSGAQTASGTKTFSDGIILGTTSTTTAGLIRYTGTDFEGRVGTSWVSLTAAGGGISARLSNSTLTGAVCYAGTTSTNGAFWGGATYPSSITAHTHVLNFGGTYRASKIEVGNPTTFNNSETLVVYGNGTQSTIGTNPLARFYGYSNTHSLDLRYDGNYIIEGINNTSSLREIIIRAGRRTTTNPGDNLILCGGCGGITSGNGGAVNICGGAFNSSGSGGIVDIRGGLGSSTTTCGDVNIYSGNSLRLKACSNGTAYLYHSNNFKLYTLSTGICVVGNGLALDWIATSDCRLKTNIQPINNALSMVTQLCGVCYEMCDDEKHENNVGLIAQDVENILPEVVSKNEPSEEDIEKFGITDIKYGLKYDKLTAVLVEAIKEQQKQIEELKSEINILKTKEN